MISKKINDISVLVVGISVPSGNKIGNLNLKHKADSFEVCKNYIGRQKVFYIVNFPASLKPAW